MCFFFAFVNHNFKSHFSVMIKITNTLFKFTLSMKPQTEKTAAQLHKPSSQR